jgi:hypothetical protein
VPRARPFPSPPGVEAGCMPATVRRAETCRRSAPASPDGSKPTYVHDEEVHRSATRASTRSHCRAGTGGPAARSTRAGRPVGRPTPKGRRCRFPRVTHVRAVRRCLAYRCPGVLEGAAAVGPSRSPPRLRRRCLCACSFRPVRYGGRAHGRCRSAPAQCPGAARSGCLKTT